jgi:hypothetical protein
LRPIEVAMFAAGADFEQIPEQPSITAAWASAPQRCFQHGGRFPASLFGGHSGAIEPAPYQ